MTFKCSNRAEILMVFILATETKEDMQFAIMYNDSFTSCQVRYEDETPLFSALVRGLWVVEEDAVTVVSKITNVPV